jgi:hypothetical protein
MDVPRSLPARVYLAAYDAQRHKLTRTSRLNHLVRTAALEELTLSGHLRDDDGKVTAPDRRTTGDPVLDGVLALVRESERRRPWKHWVTKHGGSTRGALRDQLARERVIRVERRRFLGVVPRDVVTMGDTRAAKALQRTAAQVIAGGTPTTHLDPRDVALAAIVALGELDTVCRGSVRRENRQRIKELVALSGPAVPALKKVLSDESHAAAGAAA